MLPLHGIRVLDLSRQLPGPFCSTILADFGADVLTIAAPTDPFGTGIAFLARNKRSMTLNLKHPEGKALFLRMADDADVVLEGFRPGVAERLGIDYATLSARNPRLIYCAISGYGQDGPYRNRSGHDLNYLGYAGVLNYLGHAGQAPILPGVQIADLAGGSLMAAVGILLAVIARHGSGRGQMVDIAMCDGALSLNVYHTLLYQLSGQLPQRGGAQMTGPHACYNVYETKDGREITLGAFEPHFWANICRHFGREDLIPHQWAEGETRLATLDVFRARFREKTLAEWVAELGALDICFGPVNTLDEAFADPQLRHRGMVVDVDGPAGRSVTFDTPIKLSATPGGIRTAPQPFGAQTDEVLHALGLDAEAIARLHETGAV